MRKTSQTIPKEDEKTNATEEELDVPLLPVSPDASYPNPNLPLHLDSDDLLHLTANSFVSARTIALGQTGAGKGNAGALINELLLEHGLPMTIIDPEGEAWPLKQLAKNLLVVGKSAHADREYAPEQMGRLAELSVEQGFSVILDFDDYSEEEIFALLVPYLKSLWKTCNRLRRPYHLSIDEVHEFVPQQGSTPVKELLIRVAKKGRKRGLGMLTMSQDTASIDDKFLRQTDIRVLLRVSYDSDLKRYQTLMPVLSNKTIEQEVPKMPQGKGYVIVNHVPTLVQLLRRKTFDPSETPKLGMGSQEPALQTVDDATLRLLDESLPVPSELNIERMDRAALIERIQELTRIHERTGHQIPTTSSEHNDEADSPDRKKVAALHQQLTALERKIAQQDQELRRLHKEEHALVHEKDEQIATLQATITQLEKERERLVGQLDLASKLTVSLTGLPSLEPFLAVSRSLSAEQANVEQVTVGGGTSRKTHIVKQGKSRQSSQEMHQMQETLDALVQRMELLTQQDGETVQLRRKLAHLTQQPSEPEKKVSGETHLHPREQRKLSRLIETITHLPHAAFQCALLALLLTHDGQELSYTAIAQYLHYELGTVRHRTTTALRAEGLIARAASVTGYISQFSTYCDIRFPGANKEVIRTFLVTALTSYGEEQGA